MSLLEKALQITQPSLLTSRWLYRLRASRAGFWLVQWGSVILVGLLLGLFTLYLVSGSRFLISALLLAAFLGALGLIIVGASGYLRPLLLMVILIEIPLQIDFNYGWDEQAARFNAIAGFKVSLSTVILLFLYIWWFAQILSKQVPPPRREFFKAAVPSLAYLGVATLSILVAYDKQFALFGLNLIVHSVLLYFYVMNFTRTREDVRFIFIILLFSLLLQSAILLLFSAAGQSVNVGGVAVGHVDARGRAGGTMTSPNVAGAYLALVLLSGFCMLAVPGKRWYRLLAAIGLATGGLALLATGSRGGWGGLGIAAALFAFLTWRRGWLSLKLPVAYVLLATIMFAIFHEPILERMFGEIADASAQSRGPLTLLAVYMIRDHPILGTGINNYIYSLPDYVTADFVGQWITTVHNKYLLVWAESGTLGIITFVWFLLATLWTGWKVWKRQDRLLSPFVLCFTLVTVAWMIHMTVELFSGRVQLMMLWLMAGVITAAYYMEPEEDVAEAGEA